MRPSDELRAIQDLLESRVMAPPATTALGYVEILLAAWEEMHRERASLTSPVDTARQLGEGAKRAVTEHGQTLETLADAGSSVTFPCPVDTAWWWEL